MKTSVQLNLIKAVLAFTFGFTFTTVSAKAPVKIWDKAFGGSGNEAIRIIQPTTDGGYILGGYSESGISGDKTEAKIGSDDYWVVKINSNGVKQWDKTFGGVFGETLFSLFQTPDGGYILGGYSQSGISGDKSQANKGLVDFWIVKINSTGNKIWDKSFGGIWNDRLHSIVPTSDGGFIAAGASSSDISTDKSEPSRGFEDYWVVKFDANGNKQWDKTYGGNWDDIPYAIAQTPDGGYILGGYSSSDISIDKTQASKGDNDFWIIKLNSSGTKIWDKTIGTASNDGFSDLILTSDGGYLVCGVTESGISGDKTEANKGGSGTTDYWLVKLSSTGNILWDKTIGGNDNDYSSCLLETSGGDYLIAGTSFSDISGDKTGAHLGGFDYWVVKMTQNKNIIWDKTIGGSDSDFLYCLAPASGNDFIIGGNSYSGNSGDKTQVSKGASDYWIAKLSANPTGISEKLYLLNLTISPNPNQGKFQLQLTNLNSKTAEVTISDLTGRTVYSKQLSVSENQIQHAVNLPEAKGMYIVQVKAGNQTTSRKIVVQ